MRFGKPLLLVAIIFLIINGLFLARIPMRAEWWPISVVAILLFASPVVIISMRWLGKLKGSVLMIALGAYAVIFETVAVKSGIPYGDFTYGNLLGPTMFNSVPVTVFLAWTPLILGIVAATQTIKDVKFQAVVATIGLMFIDTVLDPAAVRIGFWQWDDPGFYYGVPLVNFAGWLVSGGVAISLLLYVKQRAGWPDLPRVLTINLLLILVLWTSVNAWAGQVWPSVIGLIICWILFRQIKDSLAYTKG